jgi:hypothetical protein
MMFKEHAFHQNQNKDHVLLQIIMTTMTMTMTMTTTIQMTTVMFKEHTFHHQNQNKDHVVQPFK